METERLLLRSWREADLAPFAAMNADPRVREFFPGLESREESDASVERFRKREERDGFCLFAAELRENGAFCGFVGLQTMSFAIPGVPQPAGEIGWRLAAEYWGRGLATEGARAVLAYAFQELRLRQVVAITVPANLRSRRVMEKLGMVEHPELAFNHPQVAVGHILQRHVVYATSAVANAAAK